MNKKTSRKSFRKYWAELSSEQKKDLADRSMYCQAYLSQVAHGHRNSGSRCKRALELATGLKLSFKTVAPTSNK